MFSPAFISLDLIAYVSPSVFSQLSEEIPPFFGAGAISFVKSSAVLVENLPHPA